MPVDFSGLVGIDLGTTFSCVAHLTRDGLPRTIPNREGELITPSVLMFDGLTVIVGREAKRSECISPEQSAVCVKRDMGTDHFAHPIGGEIFRPEILSALILKRLKADAEARIGTLKHAVITVPAYFDDTRRKATQDAGRIAGLEVLDIINEPTAAALAFAFDAHLRSKPGEMDTFVDHLTRKEMTVLVYDLGGGTFDVSLVRLSPERFETLATDGDVRLGGRDWDERLLNYCADEFQKAHGSDPRKDPESLAFLYQAVEQAKHSLTVRPSTRVMVLHDAKRMNIDVTREQFDKLTASLLSRTEMTTELVVESSGLTWSGIDRILLVGGMTRVPHVRDMIRRISGKDPDCSLAADEVVAHGAAIHGGILLTKAHAARGGDVGPFRAWSNFQTIDVNSHSLGISVKTRAGYANSILIPKNTQLPVAKTRTYHTSVPNQRQVRVRILEGEAIEADACVQIGEFLIQGLPPDLPERSPIELECRYGSDGRISVTGRDPKSGKQGTTSIKREGELADADLMSAAKKLDLLEIV